MNKLDHIQKACQKAIAIWPSWSLIASILQKSSISFSEDCQIAADMLGITYDQMETIDAAYNGFEDKIDEDDKVFWELGEILRSEKMAA